MTCRCASWTRTAPTCPTGEVGEILIKGPNVMKGYWGLPDLAVRDAEGYFTIVDRKKDLIIRGGLNVYPREVEEVIYEHPAVAEAAVVGNRTPSWVRTSPRRSRSRRGARPPLRRSRPSCGSGSLPTSTRGRCGCSPSCRRDRPARSCAGRSAPR